MKNKIKLLMISILSVILITGCSSTKEAITGDSFVEISNKNYIYPSDVTSSYDYSTSAKYASGNGYKITFIEGKRQYDIEGVFLDEVKNVYIKMGVQTEDDLSTTPAMINTTTTTAKDYINDHAGGKNWEWVKVTNSSKFYYISWIDNTYLYIDADASKEKDMEKLIDALGY